MPISPELSSEAETKNSANSTEIELLIKISKKEAETSPRRDCPRGGRRKKLKSFLSNLNPYFLFATIKQKMEKTTITATKQMAKTMNEVVIFSHVETAGTLLLHKCWE